MRRRTAPCGDLSSATEAKRAVEVPRAKPYDMLSANSAWTAPAPFTPSRKRQQRSDSQGRKWLGPCCVKGELVVKALDKLIAVRSHTGDCLPGVSIQQFEIGTASRY